MDLSLSSDRRRRWRASRCVRDYIARGFGLCFAAAPQPPLALTALPKNTCHQLDSGTIRLGDGTACSEGRLNINKILTL